MKSLRTNPSEERTRLARAVRSSARNPVEHFRAIGRVCEFLRDWGGTVERDGGRGDERDWVELALAAAPDPGSRLEALRLAHNYVQCHREGVACDGETRGLGWIIGRQLACAETGPERKDALYAALRYLDEDARHVIALPDNPEAKTADLHAFRYATSTSDSERYDAAADAARALLVEGGTAPLEGRELDALGWLGVQCRVATTRRERLMAATAAAAGCERTGGVVADERGVPRGHAYWLGRRYELSDDPHARSAALRVILAQIKRLGSVDCDGMPRGERFWVGRAREAACGPGERIRTTQAIIDYLIENGGTIEAEGRSLDLTGWLEHLVQISTSRMQAKAAAAKVASYLQQTGGELRGHDSDWWYGQSRPALPDVPVLQI